MNAELSGLRKAAVLLVQMPREESAAVLAQMRESEVEAITAEIVRLGEIDRATSDAVLGEFHDLAIAKKHATQGGMELARELLVAAMGHDKADELVDRLTTAMADAPFSFLQRADPRQVLTYIQDEHPQTIALVLAHLPAALASQLLSGLPAAAQAGVAHRIALMERASPEAITIIESSLERKLSSLLTPNDVSSVGGLKPLVEIINRTDRATEKALLEGLAGRDQALADEIRSQMFMFEDIVAIEDRSMQLVLRGVEAADLATALKGAKDDVRDKIMHNLSARAAENLADEIDLLGPVRLRQVEESQQKVIQQIRALEESGQIQLRRGDDDEFVA